MSLSRSARLWLSASILSTATACAFAQSKPEFQPEVGQQGKDVVWVPSP